MIIPAIMRARLCWCHRWEADRKVVWRAKGRGHECPVSLTANGLKWIQLVGRLCVRNSSLSPWGGSISLPTVLLHHSLRNIYSPSHAACLHVAPLTSSSHLELVSSRMEIASALSPTMRCFFSLFSFSLPLPGSHMKLLMEDARRTIATYSVVIRGILRFFKMDLFLPPFAPKSAI